MDVPELLPRLDMRIGPKPTDAELTRAQHQRDQRQAELASALPPTLSSVYRDRLRLEADEQAKRAEGLAQLGY